MKVALGTVIYRAAWPYKEEFIQSVNNQTVQDFEVLIINDGMDEKEVEELKTALQRNVTVVEAGKNRTISEIRKILLAEAKQIGIGLLVLSDFDDVFDRDRVEKTVYAVDNDICIYYNNLRTFDGNIVFRYLPAQVKHYGDILEHNFLGLSNTALKMDLIDLDFILELSEVKTNVFDWYLFSRLLVEGKQGKLVEESYTYYRIAGNNIAGLNENKFENIKKEIIVKCCQYSLLCDEKPEYNILFDKYSKLKPEEAETLMQQQRNRENLGYWWSNLNLYN
ncbi:MAG: glycosyltransferase family 2 protein [Lachnospiraceae bacterium]|nr:glycosyltransferase family 2 protein [Lachnospiraceae bacterium]MCI9341697.1 glycosyltransferase family 2 protein [Lachnospiraceae bacterium]